MRVIFALIALWIGSTGYAMAQTGPSGSEPFAVVELFASEGCSSCPPADDLLRQITADAKSSGKNIYTLSFQVDYWNYLGWSDPYSSALYSQRQQQYASVLPGGVYTPEMIVNGQEAFVGSEGSTASQAIEHYLSLQPENSISLKLDQTGDDLKIDYICAHLKQGSVVNFALVERGLVSHVTAGENEGRTLEHDNVVREFRTISLKDIQGTIVIPKPQEKDLRPFSVIAFIQSRDDMHITAATKIDLK